ncbi:hypothetical protein [Pelagibius sp.]|uniref:hypothetical protein n=1 Tax=Pelagibius sp. TaxID=1931238 RepID=UPI0026146843|nr:hypothetical protein [Pelagibius sp.]
MAYPKGLRPRCLLGAVLSVCVLLVLSAAATADGFFSPTYATSAEGSPYSGVYSRTFGTTGDVPRGSVPQGDPEGLVYVIDSKGLSTYRATAFAAAETPIPLRKPLPAGTQLAAPRSRAQVPTVADTLYLQPPLPTAAGPDAPPPAESEPR